MKLISHALVAASLIVGCGVAPEDGGQSGTTTTVDVGVTSTTMDDGFVSRPDPPKIGGALIPDWFVDEGPLPGPLEEMARDLVSQSSGVRPEDVRANGSMFVTWRDSSLGCPQPGKVYLQVLTDGYLAYYEAGDSLYRVHTDVSSTAVLCDLPSVPNPLPRS